MGYGGVAARHQKLLNVVASRISGLCNENISNLGVFTSGSVTFY